MLKIVGIGNVLMGDDGIGVWVARKLKDELENEGIEVIIGETDIEYALSRINDGDFVIILDSMSSGKSPGEIAVIPIKDYRKNVRHYSQHGLNLTDLILLYRKLVEGYIIGIEAEEIDIGLYLSKTLNDKLEDITKIVGEIIREKAKELNN